MVALEGEEEAEVEDAAEVLVAGGMMSLIQQMGFFKLQDDLCLWFSFVNILEEKQLGFSSLPS